MDIIIFSHPDNPFKTNLLKKVSEFIQPVPMMIFDFNSLFQHLRSNVSSKIVIIFLISFEEELDHLLTNRSGILNARFIIVLPRGGDDLAAKGLALQPRYLGYEKADFNDVCTVMKKMIKKYGVQP